MSIQLKEYTGQCGHAPICDSCKQQYSSTRPKTVMVPNGKGHVSRQRETFTDGDGSVFGSVEHREGCLRAKREGSNPVLTADGKHCDEYENAS
jgi:hypothetical protein